ncbi:MAG: NAD-dependent epimerase/dehydratase family protein [Halioglobus sp.]
MTTAGVQALDKQKIVITGGAGLVGQNLLVKLRSRGCENIHVLDKSAHNLAIAAELHEGVKFDEADLAEAGSWQQMLSDADIVVTLHAQIGGNIPEDFYRNNVTATRNILSVIPSTALLVHVSSSVIESSANDDYSQSKAQQEQLVVESGFDYSVLRPTLMFGWFDRKHFGWLSQFMQTVPVFPVPGSGKYLRQPLYAGDFCDIIIACMKGRGRGESFNISGKEKAFYIDIIKLIKAANGSRSVLLKLPYRLFYILLAVYALFDSDPPFTTAQLKALVIDEVFEDIDWEGVFAVTATPLEQAITQTFTDPKYSKIKLKF